MDGLTLDPPIVPPIRNNKTGKAEQVDQELIDRPSIGSASSISCRRIPILSIIGIIKRKHNLPMIGLESSFQTGNGLHGGQYVGLNEKEKKEKTSPTCQ